MSHEGFVIGWAIAVWLSAMFASGCVHWLGHRAGVCAGGWVVTPGLALVGCGAWWLLGAPLVAVVVGGALCLVSVVLEGRERAMHRAFPSQHFGRLFDAVFATGCAIRGRRVVLTGASGAFGAPMKALLEARGAHVTALKFGTDYTYDDYSRCEAALKDGELLVLAHGAKGEHAMRANHDVFVALIEKFRAVSQAKPVEVWAVGSEIEAHPAWGNPDLQIYLDSKRAYARRARAWFWDRSFVYRHIVPSAFRSAMGPGLISGSLAARWAWFFVARGFRYVPVSYTGIALLNYFKFLFRIHAVR